MQVYGFLPPNLIDELKEGSNWRVRASAVERLQTYVRSLSDGTCIGDQLGEFLDFLLDLLNDPNFKIELTTLQTLGILLSIVGYDVVPHLSKLVQRLIEKLGDNKIVVRQANVKVLSKLMQTLTPKPVLEILVRHIRHKNWRVREEIINMIIIASLTYKKGIDFSTIALDLKEALQDPRARVKSTAVEAIAVIHSIVGERVMSLLGHLDSEQQELLVERFQHRQLPTISAEGLVEHRYTGFLGDEGEPERMTTARAPGAARFWESGQSGRPRTVMPPRAPSQSPSKLERGGSVPAHIEESEEVSEGGSTGAEDLQRDAPRRRAVRPPALEGSTIDGSSYDSTRPENSHSSVHTPSGVVSPIQLPPTVHAHSRYQHNSPERMGSNFPFDVPRQAVAFEEDPEAFPPPPLRNGESFLLASPSISEEPRFPSSSRREGRSSGPYSPRGESFGSDVPSPRGRGGGFGGAMSPLFAKKGAGSRRGSTHLLGHEGEIQNTSGHQQGGSGHSGPPHKEMSSNDSPGRGSGADGVAEIPSSARAEKISLWLPQSTSAREDEDEESSGADSGGREYLRGVHRREGPLFDEAKNGEGLSSDSPEKLGYPDEGGRGSNDLHANYGRGSSDPQLSSSSYPRPVHSSRQDIKSKLASLKSKVRADKMRVASAASSRNRGAFDTMHGGDEEDDVMSSALEGSRKYSSEPSLKKTWERGSSAPIRRAETATETDEEENSVDPPPNVYYTNSERAGRGVGRSESHLGIAHGDDEGGDEDLPPARRRFLASRNRPAPLETDVASLRSRASRRTPISTPSSTRSGDKLFSNAGPGKSVVEMNARPVDIIPLDDLEPVSNPAMELRQCFQQIQSNDWAMQLEGMNMLRAVSIHHADVIMANNISGLVSSTGAMATVLRNFVLAILPPAESLRSIVSRTALICIHDMFIGLGKGMDTELDLIVPLLSKKVSDTGSNFIGQEAGNALSSMVANVTPSRSLSALLNGLQHKNASVRGKIALYIDQVLDRVGASIVQLKDFDRTLQCLAKLSSEGHAEARGNGKKALYTVYLSIGEDLFETKGRKALGDSLFGQVKTIVSKMAKAQIGKGGGAVLGGDLHSRSRVSTAMDKGMNGRRHAPLGASVASKSSAGSTATATSSSDGGMDDEFAVHGSKHLAGTTMKGGQDSRKIESHIVSPEFETQLTPLLSKLGASDFRQRHAALGELTELIVANPNDASSKLPLIMDNLLQRSSDANVKVNAKCLASLKEIIPVVASSMDMLVPNVVTSLAPNLAATNLQTRKLTSEVFECMIEKVDVSLLVQPFMHCVTYGNVKTRGAMLDKVSYLVEPAYAKKPSVVLKHILPMALRMMEDNKPEVKSANNTLLKKAIEVVGLSEVKEVASKV
mmetsp:Transcript_2156/g.4433  ORF Transcript_2156/g.4433 Transcript_2156/m.4433 type:complete len:1381 (-) Transcript_2156:85-4227(-)